MPLNIGRIELGGANVAVVLYYDSTVAPGPNQPLINGPRGYCLDVSNTTGRNVKVTVAGLSGTPLTANVGQGNPVTTGQARSRTAAQLAALGMLTRGSVGAVSLE